MLNIIIFSKNRAQQLDLLICSMKKYFKEFNSFGISILYKSTSEDFKKGYDKLKDLHTDLNITWVEENGFKNSLIILFKGTFKYTVFLVDDDVIKEPFSITDEEFKRFESHGDILCLSMRLHPRLTYCYAAGVNMTPPNFKDGVFSWMGETGDYGYPMSLDGHIFRNNDISYYINFLNYDGPNPLEAQMASSPCLKPKMICYNKSILVNNPVNKVQEWNNNVHGNITAEYLNDQFLLGDRIDISTFDGLENISCHQEIPISFINI